MAHRKFWNQKENSNHDYTIYFAEGELHDADLVLHSTSMAFASLAALGGCLWFGVFHGVVPAASGVLPGQWRAPGVSPGMQWPQRPTLIPGLTPRARRR